jgi:hypothetical protein
MQIKEKLRLAFSALASLRLSREEKLKRIDLFLESVPETRWKEIFTLMQETKDLHLDLLTIEDMIVLLVKFKDFKGLHQLKQRIYLLDNRLPFLFKYMKWRRFPLGVVFKGKRVIRRSLINPLPDELYSSLGILVKKGGVSINEVNGTEIVRRGENYVASLGITRKKLEEYPNIRRFVFREISDVVTLGDWEAKKEVKRREQELQPLYLKFEQPTLPIEIVTGFKKISKDVLEQAFKISQCCASSEEEGKPLNMGIIIGDHERVARTLDTPLVEKIPDDLFLREDEWSRIRREISRKTDGVASTLIVDGEDGRILDAKTMSRLTYSEITSTTESVAFQISDNCVRIVSQGQLQYQHILNRKTGQWSLRNVQRILKEVKNIAIDKGMNPSVLNKIIEISFKLSEAKEAALYLTGDFSELERCLTKESRDRLFNSREKNILSISESEMISYSREDGAVVIDEHGILRVAQAYFTIGGGRHEVARQVTAQCPRSISIVISRDATISIYDRGHLRQEIL